MSPADTDPLAGGFPNDATPVGGLRYYAVRFAEAGRRDTLARLLAWYDAVRAVALAPRDPGVARLKLDWWRNELERLQQGGARHPLTQALQSGLPPGAHVVGDLLEVVDATEAELRSDTPLGEREFVAACEATGGALYRALATVDGLPDARAIATPAGTYCEAVERTRRVDAWPNRFYWPPGDTDIPATQWQRHCEDLLGGLADAAAPIRRQGQGRIPRRLFTLYARLDVTMRRSGFPREGRLVDRPPIAHLWTAWRNQ
jgi:15-cis-phytoene synthase